VDTFDAKEESPDSPGRPNEEDLRDYGKALDYSRDLSPGW